MNTYDRLLIELGEKSYVDEESQWPVELRLVGLIFMNTAAFIMIQIVQDRYGIADILDLLAKLNKSVWTSRAIS